MARYKVEICGVNTSTLPVLKNEEMMILFKKLQNKDESAKEKLILGNLKLVLSIVQRFAHRAENMDDLFQIGCIGLIKAIDNFDLKHEVRFSTYAVPMILGEIKRYLRDNQMIRVSRHLKDLAYRVLRAKEEYIHTYQQEPSIETLAKLVDEKESEVQEALESLQSVASIFEPIYSDDGDTLYLMDQIKDERNDIDQIPDMITLQQALAKLSSKEYEIIEKRYFKGQTQTEIASELAISQAQVSRIEKSALQSLKKNF